MKLDNADTKGSRMMVAWLVYRKADVDKNRSYIQFYMEEGRKREIEIKLMIVERLEFGVRNNTWFISYDNETVIFPEFVVCRTIYPLLSRQFEMMGIPVFNSSKVSEICNDKARTYQYVASLGIPMVSSSFYKNEHLDIAINQVTGRGPTVIKAVAGHGGSQVYLYQNCDKQADLNEVESFGAEMSTVKGHALVGDFRIGLAGSDFVLQPLTGTHGQDLRVYVIGKQIIAAVLRTANKGFKSNFSLGGMVQLYHVNQEETDIVQKIIGLFEFGMVGIDFILGDFGELIFNEIEDVVGARMLYQCTDINLVGMYLDFIISVLR